MAFINAQPFSELTGTTWDASAESNKRYKAISANTELTISNIPNNFEALLYITNSGTYTLTINGTAINIKSSNTTMIGILKVGGILKFYPEGTGSSGTGSNQLIAPVLTAYTLSSSQILLNWNDVTNETSYQLQRATNSGFTVNLATIATPTAGSTSYTDSGLSAATTYYHRIKSVDDGENYIDSDYSNSASGTTQFTWPYVSATAATVSGTNGIMRSAATTGIWDAIGRTGYSFGPGDYLEAKDANGTTAFQKMIGFTKQLTPTGYANVDFGLYLHSDGTLYKHENGVTVTPSLGTYTAGSVYRVFYDGAQIKYQRSTDNGSSWNTINTSSLTPTGYYYGIFVAATLNAQFNNVNKNGGA